MTDYSQIGDQLYQIAESHQGENVVLNLSGMDVLIVQNANDADWVLRANASNYEKNMMWLRQVLGASRFSENGAAWKLRRDLSQSHLNRFDREHTFKLACDRAKDAVEAMIEAGRHAGYETLDENLFRRLTMSVLLSTFFNVRLENTSISIDNIARIMELGSAQAFVPTGLSGQMYRDSLRELPAARARVLEDFRPFREGRLGSGALLADLMAADMDPSNDIVFEQEMLAFLAAGAETTAATLGWACYMLAANSNVQERLRVSVMEDGGADSPGGPEPILLLAFISEVLKRFPPTPVVARRALTTDQIGEHKIAPNDMILVSFIGVLYDGRSPWDVADLDLDKRLGKFASVRDSGIGTCFSFGPRICGGKHFALVELCGVLTTFLRRARFSLTSDSRPTFHWKSQLLRRGGQPVRVTPL